MKPLLVSPTAPDLSGTSSLAGPKAARVRYDAFDGLRATLLLLFLVLHSSLAYMITPLGSIWPFQDQATHPAFDLLVAFIHEFRLPLFFVMAGFFAAMLLQDRGPRRFLDNRCRRIALPLIATWPVIALPAILAYPFAEHGPSLESLRLAVRSLFSAGTLGHLQWFHLWFLFDLLVYYALALGLARVVRLLPEAPKAAALRAVGSFLESAWAPFALTILTMVILLPMHSPVFDTPGTFERPVATLLADGVFVLFGWCLYLRRDVIPRIQAGAWLYTVLGILLFAVHFGFLVRLEAGHEPQRTLITLALSGSMWFLVFGVIGLADRYYRRPRRAGRYLADASYWCYLVHLPFVVWIPLFLADLPVPAAVKFSIVLAATTGVCLVSYALFVRRTRVGVLLNGRRYPRGDGRSTLAPGGVPVLSEHRAAPGAQPAGTDRAAGGGPTRFLLIHPASVWRRQLRGRPRPTDRIFDYSVLPNLHVAAATPPDVEVTILNEDYDAIDFEAAVDLVGVSIMTMNAPRAYEIADRFRSRGVPVLAGGYHATLAAAEVLRHFDAVCVGDAELMMPRIIADLRSGRLAGVYAQPLSTLDGLPRLDRRLAARRSLFHFDTIQATRGCPERCDFCSVTAFHDHSYRRRPAADVAREMAALGRKVLFVDDNLTVNREYALHLFAAIAPLRRRWFGQCTVETAFDESLMAAAAVSGCRGMFVGFETLSKANLASTRKGFNRPERYTEAVRRFHAQGIAVFAGIVFGMDDDHPDVFERTLRFLDESRVDLAAANILTPFPGTPLFERMERDGRIRERDWGRYDLNHVVFEPLHMSAETLKQGTSWVRAQFYSRSKIARRLSRAFRYLDRGTVLGVLAPINAGFHSKLVRGPTLGHAAEFERRSFADETDPAVADLQDGGPPKRRSMPTV